MAVSTDGQLWTRVSDTIPSFLVFRRMQPRWRMKSFISPTLLKSTAHTATFTMRLNRFGRLSIPMRRMVGFQGLTLQPTLANGKRAPHQSFPLVHGDQSTVKWPPTQRSIGMTIKNCDSTSTFVWDTLLTYFVGRESFINIPAALFFV